MHRIRFLAYDLLMVALATCPVCQARHAPALDVTIDVDRLLRNGVDSGHITNQRMQMLRTLITAYPAIVTRERMMDALWGSYDCALTANKVMDVHICHIRKQIKPLGLSIEVLWRIGWRMIVG